MLYPLSYWGEVTLHEMKYKAAFTPTEFGFVQPNS